MKYLIASIGLLVAAASAGGQVVKLPPEVRGDPGSFVRVPSEGDCPSVQWYALDSGLNLFPVDLLKDSKTAVVTASKPGRYRLLGYGAKGDKASEPAVCVVVIGDAPPVPPGPGPGPGPAPVNPLTERLQSPFAADLDPQKLAHRDGLAKTYWSASQAATDPAIATWGALLARLKAEANKNGVFGKLLPVQTVLSQHLGAILPTDAAKPLDAAGRELAKNTFANVAAALEGLK